MPRRVEAVATASGKKGHQLKLSIQRHQADVMVVISNPGQLLKGADTLGMMMMIYPASKSQFPAQHRHRDSNLKIKRCHPARMSDHATAAAAPPPPPPPPREAAATVAIERLHARMGLETSKKVFSRLFLKQMR
jgi:hypothetical protein